MAGKKSPDGQTMKRTQTLNPRGRDPTSPLNNPEDEEAKVNQVQVTKESEKKVALVKLSDMQKQLLSESPNLLIGNLILI